MVRRLLRAGHSCVVYGRSAEVVAKFVGEGAVGTGSYERFVAELKPPRVVWLMVPAAAVDGVIARVAPLLAAGDILVDGGNSHYHDDLRRAAELKERGVRYLDVGTSGGVWGLERGYCLMIGGEKEAVVQLDPLFAALAPGRDAAPPTPGRGASASTAEEGYLHCGPSGAGIS
jgi:6-phosphogluconate dehydrogenase